MNYLNKFNKGDVVKVIDYGYRYSTATDIIKKNFPEYVDKYIPDEDAWTYNKNYLESIKFTVIGFTSQYANVVIYLIQNTETLEVYLFGERGLELV